MIFKSCNLSFSRNNDEVPDENDEVCCFEETKVVEKTKH